MKELKTTRYWLFDLDNTLYSGETKVFDQVDKKMSSFISKKLKISIEEAKKVQKKYFLMKVRERLLENERTKNYSILAF